MTAGLQCHMVDLEVDGTALRLSTPFHMRVDGSDAGVGLAGPGAELL